MSETFEQQEILKDFLARMRAGETAGMSADELQAGRALSDHFGVELRKDHADSLIVAWYPDPDGHDHEEFQRALAVEGGQAMEDLHLTLLYLGDPDDYDLDLVAAAVKLFTARQWGTVRARVSGLGRFVGEGDTDIVVALIDSEELEWFRRNLIEFLCDCGVYTPSSGHGFMPHITLAYVDRGTASPPPFAETIDFEIDSLSVIAGYQGLSFDFPEEGECGDAYCEPCLPYYRMRAEVAGSGIRLGPEGFALTEAVADGLTKLAELATARANPEEEAEKRALGLAEQARKRALAAEEKYILEDDSELEYAITRSRDEDRYTLGPLYAPDREDAHGEFTDSDNLQKAVWDYVRASAQEGRRINLQHDDSGEATIGEWVEVMAWPYEHTIKVAVPGEEEREITMPAGTVYLGVVWDEAAWENGIKKGKLAGYSLGGRAVRVKTSETYESMGDQSTAREV